MPHPGQWVEVFVVALVAAQGNDRLSQAPGVILVAVAIQTLREEPVDIDPDRSAPVPGREEREAVAIIAGHGRDAFVRETKARVLQRAHHAPRSLFIWYSREEGDEVGRDVRVDQPLCDEIEVQVDRVLRVPELLVHRTGRPLCPLLEEGSVLPQGARDLRQIFVGLAQERVEEHVLHQEGAVFPYPGLVVVALGEEMNEVSETVVGRVQRSVFRGNEMCVGTPVLRDLGWPELQALHDRVPHGGVVHARLPRVADIHESLTFRVTLPVEVLVPRHKLRERVLEERPDAQVILSALIDSEGGRGVNRRLDNAAGPDLRRSIRVLVCVPEVYAREVPAEVGIEYDLGQEPVAPLSVEQMCELPRGAPLVIMRVPDGDERRVPGPLVRVEPGTWLGVLPGPVKGQDQLRLTDEIDFVFQHALCLPLGTRVHPNHSAPLAGPDSTPLGMSPRRIPAK